MNSTVTPEVIQYTISVTTPGDTTAGVTLSLGQYDSNGNAYT
jgi:hypothetical protein